MDTAPVFASAAEAMAVVRAGLDYLAAADAAAMAAGEQARCLRGLEQATPEVHGYRPRPGLGYRVYTGKALEIAATARLAPPDPAGCTAAPPTAT